MEEYEVDLRDYLRVIWERKWIVLGVFLAAVAAAAGFSYTLPDEYEASALLQWDSSPPFADLQLQLPSLKGFIELMKRFTHPGVEFKSEALGDTGFISLKLRGPLPPKRLEELLAQQIADIQAFLSEQLSENVAQEIAIIEQQEGFLDEQRTDLLEQIRLWIDERLESLLRQREELIKQVEGLLTLQQVQGENIQLQANILALTGQLQAVHSELIRLETEKGSAIPRIGSGVDAQLAELERSLRQLETSKIRYLWVLETNWMPMRVVKGPQGSPDPVGPPRRLNISIAGVLGLFTGVLLAFFVHYLQGTPQSRREQAPPDTT